MAETEFVSRGKASDPTELAGEIAEIKSNILRLPYVEAMEVVTVSMSAANRDLIVRALRSLPSTHTTNGE